MQTSEHLSAEHDRKKIDYRLVDKAIKHYEALGYSYLEVPWWVTPHISEVTFSEASTFSCSRGILVGSAEQSFISLLMAGQLVKDFYVAATPCFRDDKPDSTHCNSFFKVELWAAGDAVSKLLSDARSFFQTLGVATSIVNTEQGFDLNHVDLELGSYGIRTWGGKTWTYGTGLALPRFSMCL